MSMSCEQEAENRPVLDQIAFQLRALGALFVGGDERILTRGECEGVTWLLWGLAKQIEAVADSADGQTPEDDPKLATS